MNCKKCGSSVPETTLTGICGPCAFKSFRDAGTAAPFKLRDAKVVDLEGRRHAPLEESAAAEIHLKTDREIELVILNGFLHDQFLLGKTLNEGFDREMLAIPEGRAVFDQIQKLYTGANQDKVVDPLIVKNQLKIANQYTPDMEAFFTQVMAQKTPQLSQVLAYLRIMKEHLAFRKMHDINKKISRYLQNDPDLSKLSFLDFSADVTKEIRDLQRTQTRKTIELVKSQMIEIAADINYREKYGERTCLGYDLKPFDDFTNAISGLRKGFLYGIAGAPRRGKTTFTLEVATLCAANSRVPVLFFTWEQTKKNLTYRLLAKETRINPDTLQRRNIRADKTSNARFAEGWRKMESYMDHLYIIEGSKDDTIDRIKAHAYNAMQDAQTDEVVIVCDYLQKMPLSRNYSDEKFRVEEISTDLKRLSIELNCPIIVISSLNKEGCLIEMTENDDERPGLYHCKGSGDVEYDLDCAIVLSKAWGDTRELMSQMSHRAEARGKDSIHVPKIDILDLYLDKNRDAPEGKSNCVQFFFFIEENRFFELGYKDSTNAFRFNKIEKMLDGLEQEGFIRYREIEGGRKTDAKQEAAMGGPREATAGFGNPDERRKIRLKRE